MRPSDFFLPFSLSNSISVLDALAAREDNIVPSYEYGTPQELGYDKSGKPIYVCTCRIAEWGITRQVWTSSRKLAKRCAANLTLCERCGLQNEYGSTSRHIIWRYDAGALLPDHLFPSLM